MASPSTHSIYLRRRPSRGGNDRLRSRDDGDPVTAPSWGFVPIAPADATFHQLVAIAVELEKRHTEKFGPLYGVQTSWLPRVMEAAGLVVTASYRKSPVKRQHSSPHRVWVRREVNP